MDATRAAQAVFLLGVMLGMLLLLVGQELVPEEEDPGVAEFRRVRDFARSHFVRELSDEELVEAALHGMIDGLDPYSRYYDRSQSETVRRETDGDFRGVGIIFRRPVEEGRVLFPLEDTPAWEAGVRVGDRFVEIDGVEVAGLDEETFRSLLAPEGSDEIEVRAVGLDGAERLLTLRPRVLVDPTVRHVELIDPERGIGYLAIRSFTHQTAAEFDDALEELRAQGLEALVVDLRFNYGGVLDAAVDVARRFVPEGTIVSSEGRVETEMHAADADAARYAGLDVVVLMDGDSASASEVLAGALQDHRVGVVVGAPSYGKGMLQTIRTFPRYGTRAKVTSAYYYSPSRRNFERTSDPDREFGILPDLHVPIDSAARRRVHVHVQRYDPPPSVLADLRAWGDEEDVSLLPEPPTDAQLDAALGLLRGVRPGPRPLDPPAVREG